MGSLQVQSRTLRSGTQENEELPTAFNVGVLGTSNKYIFSGTVGMTAWLVQERMKREKLETGNRVDLESFHKTGSEKPGGGWRETWGQESWLLFFLMGKIIAWLHSDGRDTHRERMTRGYALEQGLGMRLPTWATARNLGLISLSPICFFLQ